MIDPAMELADWTRAVIERPDDDALRLVFADWLEERGHHQHARMVRSGCALGRSPTWKPGWAEHWNEFREVSVSPKLPDGVAFHSFAFSRGFPQKLRIERLDALLANVETVFSAGPIDALHVDGRVSDATFAAFLALPQLARIRKLVFSLGEMGPERVRLLDACPRLERLQKIGFAFGAITGEGLHAFVHSGLARRVRALGVTSCFHLERGAPLVRAFSGASLELSFLDLGGNGLDAEGLSAVLAAVPGVEHLSLRSNPLGAAGAEELARAPRRLQMLDLAGTGIRLAGVRALVTSGSFAELEALGLASNELGPLTVKAFAAAQLPALQFLDLSSNKLDEANLRALLQLPVVKRLLRADLRNLRGTPELQQLLFQWYLRNPAQPGGSTQA